MIGIDIQKTLHGAQGEMVLDLKLEIEKGSFVALSGLSGSGKTTLLRILAGLEDARGTIEVDGRIWHDAKRSIPPQKRDIGFVFQEYALFTNMNVLDNLLYAKHDDALATYLLDITGLSSLKKRLPQSLSGGQKQRVALCRALMRKPKLLLMDEPLSALDPAMRLSLQEKILSLHKEFGMTTLMVSHDPSEMYRMASRVLVLEAGKITHDGTPKSVLLQTSGSQKFSFEGELLAVEKRDVIYVAIVAIGQQLVEVVLSESRAKMLNVGEKVRVSTKAFSPSISAIG